MLSRHEGQPQSAGAPVGEFGSVEPVDPQRRVEVAARRPVDGSVHAQFRVPSPPPRQKWPVGSSGWPQNGHGGRPPASSTSARAHEAAGMGHVDPDAKQVRAVLGIVRQLEVVAIIGRRLRLDDDRLVSGIPRQGHRADAEELDDRLLEPVVIGGRGAVRGIHGVEEVAHPLRESGDLDLLEADAHEGPALARLEVEDPLAGLANRAGNEPVGIVEDEEPSRHRGHATQ